MKKCCLVAMALTLCLLLPVAPARADSDDKFALANSHLTTGFALARNLLVTNPSDINAQNAYNMAYLAQYYASYAAANDDEGAARVAYAFGILAAQYSFNAYLTTGNMSGLIGYAFCYVGAIQALKDTKDD